ncbi:MAG: SMI1/KNR4 family protein [Rhodocyclaceae bacterium]|nr:SMI1/KNR4 family protein [Rhodocyclaceae bacterium]MBX3667871.1 SMI1/KNR4 family protein [Rhodocyclaceae bacterium]
MFKLPPGMIDTWRAMGKPIASPADIARLESELGTRLPAPYVEFVGRYGFVVFGGDAERRAVFSYVIDQPGQREAREDVVRYMFNPDMLMTIYRYMISTDEPDDESRPMIPRAYLPVASDAGHGRILLELEGRPGRVWYWPERDSRWGTEDNTQLGYVAENFEDFINGLRPDPL